MAISPSDSELARAIEARALPLAGSSAAFDALLRLVGDARLVLVGEATHGTQEFYRLRAQLTQRLILEKGFCAVAVEADWPDAYRVNRYVRALGDDRAPAAALCDFRRFPRWMWRNVEVLELVGWLRSYNDGVDDPRRRAGFYGLDLYSLHASMAAVVEHLEKVDPPSAERARYRYSCFDHFGEDPQSYGYAVSFGLSGDCEREVVAQLVEMQKRRQAALVHDGARGVEADEDHFAAEQNARLVQRAEGYYRAMFRGRVSSWNLRDTHMADTLDALIDHLDRRFGRSKIVVWAHNSHVGDARATEMGVAGEINIGQLARERHPGQARLIGFTTYDGTVTAASRWDGPVERKVVRPALARSYERLFHQTGVPSFVLTMSDLQGALAGLQTPRLERAIGVIYAPETERVSHYFNASLPAQFDAVIHVDRTRALEPLDREAGWEREDLPETYPTGL